MSTRYQKVIQSHILLKNYKKSLSYLFSAISYLLKKNKTMSQQVIGEAHLLHPIYKHKNNSAQIYKIPLEKLLRNPRLLIDFSTDIVTTVATTRTTRTMQKLFIYHNNHNNKHRDIQDQLYYLYQQTVYLQICQRSQNQKAIS